MSYSLHLVWDYGSERLEFRSRESVCNFLYSGFAPPGCRIEVEHKGKRHQWDREADYAKPWRRQPPTQEFNRLLRRQNAESEQRRKWLVRRKTAK